MSTTCNGIHNEPSIQKAEKWKLLSHEQQFFMLVGEFGAEATPYDWFFESRTLLLLVRLRLSHSSCVHYILLKQHKK